MRYQILWVYGVYSCYDRTDNKVISDIVGIWFVAVVTGQIVRW